mgnify:FL=1
MKQKELKAHTGQSADLTNFGQSLASLISNFRSSSCPLSIDIRSKVFKTRPEVREGFLGRLAYLLSGPSQSLSVCVCVCD